MYVIDTHCHIHSSEFGLDGDALVAEARVHNVQKLIVVGTNVDDSEQAVAFAEAHDGVWAVIGVHPHDAKTAGDLTAIENMLKSSTKVVGVGETGLDYWYMHSEKSTQEAVLRRHLELAVAFGKPLSLHIRGSKEDPDDAFEDFFRLYDEYAASSQLRGVVHSFTSGQKSLDGVLSRGLLVGINGIITFTNNAEHIEAVKTAPPEAIIFETDTPYLTPVPKRGKINEPANVRHVVEFVARLRGESFSSLAKISTFNAETLFTI